MDTAIRFPPWPKNGGEVWLAVAAGGTEKGHRVRVLFGGARGGGRGGGQDAPVLVRGVGEGGRRGRAGGPGRARGARSVRGGPGRALGPVRRGMAGPG